MTKQKNKTAGGASPPVSQLTNTEAHSEVKIPPKVKKPDLPIFGFLLSRVQYGWQTICVKSTDSTFEIVKTTEPDTKVNALYKGTYWIEENTR